MGQARRGVCVVAAAEGLVTANESCVTASSGRRISVTFGVNISMVKTPDDADFIADARKKLWP